MSIERKLKHFWQRRTRGWDDSDVWCLDITHARWILPRLQRFLEVKTSYPSEFVNPDDDTDDSGFQKWQDIVQKMINAFSIILKKEDDPDWIYLNHSEENVSIEEGLALFAKYHGNLWW